MSRVGEGGVVVAVCSAGDHSCAKDSALTTLSLSTISSRVLTIDVNIQPGHVPWPRPVLLLANWLGRC